MEGQRIPAEPDETMAADDIRKGQTASVRFLIATGECAKMAALLELDLAFLEQTLRMGLQHTKVLHQLSVGIRPEETSVKVPRGFTPLVEACRRMLTECMAGDELALCLAALDFGVRANRVRDRVIHDLWMASEVPDQMTRLRLTKSSNGLVSTSQEPTDLRYFEQAPLDLGIARWRVVGITNYWSFCYGPFAEMGEPPEPREWAIALLRGDFDLIGLHAAVNVGNHFHAPPANS